MCFSVCTQVIGFSYCQSRLPHALIEGNVNCYSVLPTKEQSRITEQMLAKGVHEDRWQHMRHMVARVVKSGAQTLQNLKSRLSMHH